MTRKPSLRSRVISAGLWTMGGQAAAQLLRLVSNLLLTRLLAPEMFGVMAVAWTVIAAIGMFSDIGLSQNVVRSTRGDDPRFLNTVWTVQVIRGAMLTAVTLALAGILALAAHAGWLRATSTYAHPDVPWVLAAISLAILIGGFRSTKLISASRKLASREVVTIELASQLVGLVVMIAWANVQPTVFVLVYGALVSSAVSVGASHIFLHGVVARFDWEPEALREIREFGSWVVATSIMGFLVRLGDRVIMGWLLNAAMMGLYSIASIMAEIPQLILSKLMSSVALPTLAEVYRQDPGRLRAMYYRIRLPVDAFSLVTMGALFVAGEPIVRLLYDGRYVGAGAMLEVLALKLFAGRYSVTSQFYLVLGKSRMMANLQAIRLGTMVLAIPIGHALGGTMGAVWGIALSPILDVIWAVFVYQRRLGILDARRELLALLFVPLGMALGGLLGFTLEALLWR